MAERSAQILIVDDEESVLSVLRSLVESRGYRSLSARSAEAALSIVQTDPPDLILLDVEMPGMSGVEFVARLKADARTQTIPVIMVTGFDDRETRLNALESGAEDYLAKPVDPAELWVRVRNHLRLKEYSDLLSSLNSFLKDKVQERSFQLEESYRETIYLLTNAAEYRDRVTGSHVKRIATFARELAGAMGFDSLFANAIYFASPMHDIGKIGIPDTILRKPEPLSGEEWEIMKQHTRIGARMLESGSTPYIKMGAEIALTHHESWDGSGYPSGLKGEQIPIAGRIVKLCDQYDALRSERPYKKARDHETTVEVLFKGDGRTRPDEHSPDVLEAFRTCRDAFKRIYAETV